MGRPPCCDKVGVKKGPWTPEEDIILVSYIQENGPGNWRSVPTNTGLLRCSKSCRLRWTNYLRPGIKRGNFTDQEEKLIVHLQALLGNRWAAIASYLPERTDNDIKNYWNIHLRKKLTKIQAGVGNDGLTRSEGGTPSYSSTSKGQWERRLQTDINMAKRALSEALSLEKPDLPSCSTYPSNCTKQYTSPATYASSAENISRLLQEWTKKSSPGAKYRANSSSTSSDGTNNNKSSTTTVSPDSLHSLFQFDSSTTPEASETSFFQEESKVRPTVPLSFLETWLFDYQSGGHGHEDLVDMQLDDSAEELF